MISKNSALSEKPSTGVPLVAALELVGAGALWGFGFIAAVWALKDIAPFMMTFLRFSWIAVVGLPILWLIPKWKISINRTQWKLSFFPGFWLSLTILLQTWGLKYTTATKSGFITTLYVLMVPFLERYWLKRRLPASHWMFALVALVGVGLIVDLHGGDWNVGDLLTFACAIAATIQIFWFGLIADRIESPMTFNIMQSTWAAVIACPFAIALNPWPNWPMSTLSWVGLASLTFGSTLIAFGLQIKAQKVIPPSHSSLFFLLESPFATLFAFFLLGERLSWSQWAGGALILLAILAATLKSSQTQVTQEG